MADELAHFQDRDRAIAAFDALWDAGANDWMLAFHGFSGHGKTLLIRWLEVNRCQRDGIPHSVLDFRRASYHASFKDLLDGILEHEGLWPHIPRRACKAYREQRDAIMADQAKNHMVTISQTMTHVSDSEQTMSAAMAQICRFTDQKARDRLADAWMECIEDVNAHRLVLFFDTFEHFQDHAAEDTCEWFWSTLRRAHTCQPGLRVVLGCQDAVRGPEHGFCADPLDPLSPTDSDALLGSMGVDDPDYRAAVYERLAHGHPLVTRLVAEAWEQARQEGQPLTGEVVPAVGDLEKAVEWVQGRIIERLREPLKSAARWGALLRGFNAEALNAALEEKLDAEAFRRFVGYSFVVRARERPGWRCHELVRRAQIDVLREERPEAFAAFHRRAMAYWQDRDEIEALYHRFFTQPDDAFEAWANRESEAARRYDRAEQARLFDLIESREIVLPDVHRARMLEKRGELYQMLSENMSARERYQDALSIYRRESNRLGEANCILRLGEVHRILDEHEKAREQYKQALSIYQEIGHKLGEANCIMRLGDVHLTLAEIEKARKCYVEAVPIYQKVGDRVGQANCIQSLGDAHLRTAEYRAARDCYAEALLIYREIGERIGEANCIKKSGDVYLAMTEYGNALENYAKALPVYQEVRDRLGEASCISRLGDVYLRKSEYGAARAHYAKALPIYHDIGDRLGEANCIQSLGDVHFRFAEHGEAAKCYTEALSTYCKIGDPHGQANSIKGLGDVHWILSEHGEAAKRYTEALSIYSKIADPRGEANCIQSLGDVHRMLAEYGAARARYEEALPMFRRIGDRLGEAKCIGSLGNVHLRLDETEAARNWYGEALSIFQEIGGRLGEANCIQGLGDVHLKLDETEAARERYTEALPIYRQIGERQWAANCLKSLGEVHRREGDREGAAILFQQAADLYHSIHLLRDETVMKAMTAQLRLDQGQPREALKLMWEALQYFETHQLPGDVGVACNILRKFRQRVEGFATLWQEVTGRQPPDWLIDGDDG